MKTSTLVFCIIGLSLYFCEVNSNVIPNDASGDVTSANEVTQATAEVATQTEKTPLLKKLVEKVKNKLSSAPTDVKNKVKSAVDKIKSEVNERNLTNIDQSVGSVFKEMAQKAKDKIASAPADVKEGILTAVEKTRNFFHSLFKRSVIVTDTKPSASSSAQVVESTTTASVSEPPKSTTTVKKTVFVDVRG